MKTKLVDSHEHENSVKVGRGNYFYIVDWAGNHKFPSKTFKTFDEAWGFLHTKFDSDEDLGEFYVLCNACEPISIN